MSVEEDEGVWDDCDDCEDDGSDGEFGEVGRMELEPDVNHPMESIWYVYILSLPFPSRSVNFRTALHMNESTHLPFFPRPQATLPLG